MRKLFLTLMTSLVCACATIGGWFNNNPADVQAIVIIAVDLAIAKGIPAAKINEIATAALAADQGTAVTLAAISAAINVEIAKLNLPAADMAAIEVFEATLDTILTAYIGNNTNVANTQVAIAVVLKDVIAATNPLTLRRVR
jgi:hypothetical protein